MYKLLVLGDFPRGDVFTSTSCFQIITTNFVEALKDFPHIEVFTINNYGASRETADSLRAKTQEYRDHYFQPIIDQTPEVDFIIYIDWDRTDIYPMDKIREKAKAKYVVSLLELYIGNVDWCFCFRKHGPEERRTIVEAPLNRRIYQTVPKKKKLLLDHPWESFSGALDWTLKISDWVEPVKNEYEIVRMLRFDQDIKHAKPHEQVIRHQEFGNYLTLTNDVETYIMTHQESYGFGVIDMVARGIRVIAPKGFLSKEMVKRFRIPTFKNQRELLTLVTAPVEPRWATAADVCISYQELIKIIDEHLCAVS